jgi:hypothetical protein
MSFVTVRRERRTSVYPNRFFAPPSNHGQPLVTRDNRDFDEPAVYMCFPELLSSVYNISPNQFIDLEGVIHFDSIYVLVENESDHVGDLTLWGRLSDTTDPEQLVHVHIPSGAPGAPSQTIFNFFLVPVDTVRQMWVQVDATQPAQLGDLAVGTVISWMRLFNVPNEDPLFQTDVRVSFCCLVYR